METGWRNRDIVFWEVADGGTISPHDPVPFMPDVPKGSILVLGGRGPVWRFGMAMHYAHGSAAAAVATFDPKLGAVVVMSHVKEILEGDIINVDWPKKEKI